MRWHPVQWHADVNSGALVTWNRMFPQRQPPSIGKVWSVMSAPLLLDYHGPAFDYAADPGR
ncbi:hypothetical protein ACVWZA_001673 [Sphingomonas sp. UYAg733]